jgi:hypothetical protein
MTRAQYRALPAEKVAFYRAARKDLREMRRRAGTAKRLARLLKQQDALRIVLAQREADVQAMLALRNAAIEKRHHSKQYFNIHTMWEWNGLYLWIPKETNA